MKVVPISEVEGNTNNFERVTAGSDIEAHLTAVDNALRRKNMQLVKSQADNGNIYLSVVESNNKDDIVSAFRAGYEQEEWRYRTARALADETGLTIEEVNEVLENDSDFESRQGRGRAGLRWTYTHL